MATMCAGVLTTAGSTTLPIAALIGSATKRLKVREMEITNVSGTAVALRLCRLSTAGTPGSSATTDKQSDPESTETPVGVVKGTYSSTAPTTTDAGKRIVLGAGAAIIWSFPNGFAVPATANAGVGVLVDNGTGQACQIDFTWDE